METLAGGLGVLPREIFIEMKLNGFLVGLYMILIGKKNKLLTKHDIFFRQKVNFLNFDEFITSYSKSAEKSTKLRQQRTLGLLFIQ